MMNTEVKIQINLKNGNVMKFSQHAGRDSDSVDLKQLQASVKKIQEDSNKALTEVINKEKIEVNNSDSSKLNTIEDIDGDEDDDDDEEEDEVKEPAGKKLKT